MAKQKTTKTERSEEPALKRPRPGDDVSITPKQDDPVARLPQPGDDVSITPKQDDPIARLPQPGDDVSITPKQDDPVARLPQPGEDVSITPKQDDPVARLPQPGHDVSITPKQDDPHTPQMIKVGEGSDSHKDDEPVELPTPGGARPTSAKKDEVTKLPTPGGISPAVPKKVKIAKPGIVSSLVKLNQTLGEGVELPKIQLPSTATEPKKLTKSEKIALLRAAHELYDLPVIALNAKPSSYSLTPDSPVVTGTARLAGSSISFSSDSNWGGYYCFSKDGYLRIRFYDLVPGKVYVITLYVMDSKNNSYTAYPTEGSKTTGMKTENGKIAFVFMAKSVNTEVFFWEEKYNGWFFLRAEIMLYKS